MKAETHTGAVLFTAAYSTQINVDCIQGIEPLTRNECGMPANCLPLCYALLHLFGQSLNLLVGDSNLAVENNHEALGTGTLELCILNCGIALYWGTVHCTKVRAFLHRRGDR